MSDVQKVFDEATAENANFGEFLQKIATHLHAEIARGGTDVDLLVSRMRRTANDLQELAYNNGAERPAPTGPARTVVASPHPNNQGGTHNAIGQGMVGGWGGAPHAQPPQRLPPNTLPVPVDGRPDGGGNAAVIEEPAPGENPILDMHRATLDALGVPRMT